MSQPLQVRAERAPFVMLPRWLLYHDGVGEGAKFLYCVLHDLVNGRQGPTRPVTRAELAGVCGTSVDTVDRRLAELVKAGAVEKQAQIRSGGQVANVYQVWFTPSGGLHRHPDGPTPAVDNSGETAVENRGRTFAAPVEGSAKGQVNRSRNAAAPPSAGLVEPQPCGPGDRRFAAPSVLKEEEPRTSPPTPRAAGGQDPDDDSGSDGRTGPAEPADPTGGGDPGGRASRRAEGTNPRALGTHPRAAERAAAAEAERERVARAEAELAAAEADRLAADRAGEEAKAAFEAEALTVSAALDDGRLAAVVEASRAGLAGPLARSPLSVSRAVVEWCRAAAAELPGVPLAEAVEAALAATRLPGGDPQAAASPLEPAAEVPSGTVPLRRRVANLLTPVEV